MVKQIQQECIRLLFAGKRIDRDTLRILRKFYFFWWWLLLFLVKHLGRREQESRILRNLNDYLSEVELVRARLSYFPREMRSDVFYFSVMRNWKRLDERLLMALLNAKNIKKVRTEIIEEHDRAVERRARVAYLRALYEICWLSSFFVFRMEQSSDLEQSISLIRSRQYDKAYELAEKVHDSMKLAYLETIIEKVGYYVVFVVLGIVGAAIGQFGSGTGFWVGALALLLMFLFLPYRTFMKLYFD